MTEVVSSQSGTDSDAPEGFSEILGDSRPYYGIDSAGRKPSSGSNPAKRKPSYGEPVEGTFAGKPNLKHASPGQNRKEVAPSVSLLLTKHTT